MKILISGCGIAGLTAAYWLSRSGHNCTIIEKRLDLSDQGYMIDFYGTGFDVAERMGMIEELREKHYYIPKLVFVDGNGRRRAELNVQKFRKSLRFRHYNFMRGDLASVLYDNKPTDCEVIFGQSISAICLTRNKVGVNLQNGDRFEFDLLIGADGIHSQVRKLLWGDESRYSRFLGHYVACSVIDNFLDDKDTFYSYIEPGKQAAVYPIRGNKLATFFIFPSSDPRVRIKEEQLQLLDDHFGSMGWIVPQCLERTKNDSRLYFDAVSQIELTSWYQNRVVLLGDACHCLTLLAGQGASLAMAGSVYFCRGVYESKSRL